MYTVQNGSMADFISRRSPFQSIFAGTSIQVNLVELALLACGVIKPKIGSSTAKASRGGAETRRFDGFSDGIGIYALDVRKDVLHQLGEG